MDSKTLKQRQEAGERVEKEMLEFMLQYTPAQELQVRNILDIAFRARGVAFDAFSEIESA